MVRYSYLVGEYAPEARSRITRSNPPQVIRLPEPDQKSGLPLMTALSCRCSTREFSPTTLSNFEIGELLWAADGVNRPVSGGRTAPSPQIVNEVDVYVSMAIGVYRYDSPSHSLLLKHPTDVRDLTGWQTFAGEAPLDLFYVARTAMFLKIPNRLRERFSAIKTGAIAQNVSLYCASAGLGCLTRGWFDQRRVAEALELDDSEVPMLAQTVGLRMHA